MISITTAIFFDVVRTHLKREKLLYKLFYTLFVPKRCSFECCCIADWLTYLYMHFLIAYEENGNQNDKYYAIAQSSEYIEQVILSRLK